MINILYLICADGNDLYVSCNPWQWTEFLSPYNLDEMAPHGAFSVSENAFIYFKKLYH